jgi:hypothetical protein
MHGGLEMHGSARAAGGIAVVLVLVACGAWGCALGTDTRGEGGLTGGGELLPVLDADLMQDPWTVTSLAFGYKVYAGRATVEGKEVLDGPYRAYGPDGVLVVRGTYKNGLPDGEFRYWYESGRPGSWITYSNGREVGTSVTLYEDGRPERICYRNMNGERDGAEAYWDADGRLEASLLWAEGRPRQLVLYEDGVPSETLTGEAAEKRTLQMIRQAMSGILTDEAAQESAYPRKQAVNAE